MWVCYKYIPKNKIKKWRELGRINLPADCFGDELYNHMVENRWVDTMDDYDCAGDSEEVMVTGHKTKDGVFRWTFFRNGEVVEE